MSTDGDQAHPRGVYRLTFTDAAGATVLAAIDSRGREVARASVPQDAEDPKRDHALGYLRALLRVLDHEHEEAEGRRRGFGLVR